MCILKTENEKRRKNERSVSLVRFFRALKCVKFCFCVVKYKVIGTIAAVLQMYTFWGAVYICNVHFGGWVSDVFGAKPCGAFQERRAKQERENEVYQSEQAVIGLSPMLIF